MTGNFHVAASLMQKVLKLDAFSWFQLVLAATYSGAFHPTAEGQAAIADAVVHKARGVLAKYGQGPEQPLPAAGIAAPPAAPSDCSSGYRRGHAAADALLMATASSMLEA